MSMYWAEENGGGAPVVLVHGMGCDHRTWDLVRPVLGRTWRVLTPDLPGHGRSPKPRVTYDFPFYTSQLAAWLDGLGVGPVHLVGHSLGGALAVALTLERPDLVASVATVSSVRLVDQRPPAHVLRAFMRFGLAQALWKPSRRATRRFLEDAFGVSPSQVTDEMITLWQETHQQSRRAVLSTNRALRWPESLLYARLDQVKKPTAMFWGTRDPLFPGQERIVEVARRFGEASYELMDCGHLPMFEQPEAFLGWLQRHLDAVSGDW